MPSPMTTNHHHILRQILELDVGPGIPAPQLQEAVARSFWERAVPELEAVFDDAAGPGEYLRLDRLEIDLGSIEGADWEPQFRTRLVEQLAERLAQFQPVPPADGGREGSGDHSAGEPLSQFLFFLAHGRLPWWGVKPEEGWPEGLLPRFDPAGWTALQRLLSTDRHAGIRLINAVSDDFLGATVEAWTGLRNTPRVLANLTPGALPAGTVRSWRQGFWALLLDWAGEGSPRSQGGAFMLRLLEQRDSFAGPVWPEELPDKRAFSSGATAASTPPSLPTPWQEWLAEALRLRASSGRVADTASAVPASSLRPAALPEPRTEGTAWAGTDDPDSQAEAQPQVPNTVETRNPLPEGAGPDSTTLPSVPPLASGRTPPEAARVSLPVSAGTGIPDTASPVPASSLRPDALPRPRTEGSAGAGTSETDRRAGPQPQVPNTIEIGNSLPEGERLDSTTLHPLPPLASGRTPPDAARVSLPVSAGTGTPDKASPVPASSFWPDALPGPRTEGSTGAETSETDRRAEPQPQVPNTAEIRNPLPPGEGLDSTTLPPLSPSALGRISPPAARVSLPVSAGAGIPDTASPVPASSLRPDALPRPRTEGTAEAGTSEPDRRAEPQPQAPNTVETRNPLPQGQRLDSTTLAPLSPSALGRISPAAARKSLALPEEGEAIYLEGAGAVILHPFLEELFRDRELLAQRDFRDAAARHRGVHLLGLLGFGREGIPEYKLLLAKLLCGLPFEEPLEPAGLDDDDRAACGTLLRAVLGHWAALRSGSPDWLREQFFLREGKLEAVDSGWRLTVERRVQDVLLARLPWGLGVIGLPWMEERIFVRWTE